MGCKYKSDCPSSSGWCEGPQQHYERCVPFLISATNRCIHESAKQKAETDRWKIEAQKQAAEIDRWKLDAQKQAAETGEMMISLAERLEAVRTDIAVSEQLLLDEDSELDRVILQWKVSQKKSEAEWLERVLYGKHKESGRIFK
ncbi:MAG: hypothetical protein MR992_14635 [Lachnospiraceae bacterium]|nr:hypothetical protein [Lachnospiraceae bacterium]